LTEKEFKQFFTRNFNGLRSYLYYRSGDEELATDIAQDTFVRLWEKQIYDEGKKTVGLAYKIANDLFISKHRRIALETNYLNSPEFEFTNYNPEIAERLGIRVKAVEKRMKGALGTFRGALTPLVYLFYLAIMAESIFTLINNSEIKVLDEN